MVDDLLKHLFAKFKKEKGCEECSETSCVSHPKNINNESADNIKCRSEEELSESSMEMFTSIYKIQEKIIDKCVTELCSEFSVFRVADALITLGFRLALVSGRTEEVFKQIIPNMMIFSSRQVEADLEAAKKVFETSNTVKN
jgi:sugar-specific transcriptional regulator TrmB